MGRARALLVGALCAVLAASAGLTPSPAAGGETSASTPDSGTTGALPTRDRPDAATCRALRPPEWQPTIGHGDRRGTLRVFGIQYKLAIEHVRSYRTFRTAMRCLMEDFVVPHLDPRKPTLVVFPEDVGLATLAVGERGALVRERATSPLRAPAGDEAPLSAAAALAELNAAYAPQVAAYQQRFGPIDPRKELFVAATDTFARAFSRTFADIARDYGVYVVASNNQARYRATRDPLEVELFADPAHKDSGVAYVARSARVTNGTFLWAPYTTRPRAAAGERNLMFRNDKVPLTSLELDLLGLDEGASTGRAGRRNAAGAVVEGFRLGFGTSLPAFTYGYPYARRPDGLRPCADTSVTFMACMDHLGVDVVVQAEANPTRWAGPGGYSTWQPLEWMGSTWRAVADPTVDFQYNVTAHMVGNLLDLVFDGQSAITRRGAAAPPRHYVGNARFLQEDESVYRPYAGAKSEFLALTPWVVPDGDRDRLRAVSAALAPGSGDPRENRYLQTAVLADLVPRRR